MNKVTNTKSAAPYAFPADVADKISHVKLLPTSELRDWFSTPGDAYTGAFRRHHCLLNLVLADRGIAPVFRHVVSGVTRAHGLTPEQQTESNDRQVHDLYWLHKKYRHVLNPPNRKMQALLNQNTFDFELASEMVASMNRVADKLKHFGITPSMQIELFVLKSREVASLSKTYIEKSRRLEIALRERALRPQSKLKIENIPQIMEELMALDLAGGSPTWAATFWSKMTGGEVSEQLIERLRQRRNWFRKEYAVVFEDGFSKLTTAGLSNEECRRDVDERQNWYASKKAASSCGI